MKQYVWILFLKPGFEPTNPIITTGRHPAALAVEGVYVDLEGALAARERNPKAFHIEQFQVREEL